MDNNYKAHVEFNKFFSLFQEAGQGKSNYFTESNKEHIVYNKNTNEFYPENYGGAYYDARIEKLIVNLTSKSKSNQFEGLVDGSIVSFKEVKYSLLDLLRIMDIIQSVMPKYNITQIALKQENQVIMVYGTETFEKDSFVDFLKEAKVDLNCICFFDEIITFKNTSKLQAGDGIALNNKDGDLGATVCCNAYKNIDGTRYNGVITAGHAYEYGYYYYTDDGSPIGPARDSIHINGGMYDAMFIPFGVNCTLTLTKDYIYRSPLSKIKHGTITSIASPVEGTTVAKYGINSQRVTGTVYDTYSVFYRPNATDPNRILMYNFFEITGNQVVGDSGAPVGVETGTKPNKQMSLIGMATMVKYESGTPVGASCCKATVINSGIASIYR